MDPQEIGKVTVHKRRKPLAIIAAVCILLVGAFIAWLCIDFHPHKCLEKSGSVSFPAEAYSGMASNYLGHPFTFFLEEDIPLQWDVQVNSGSFLMDHSDDYKKREYVLDNGQTIYWNQLGGPSLTIEKTDQIYIEAILYAESHIVGYCVIELQVLTLNQTGSNTSQSQQNCFAKTFAPSIAVKILKITLSGSLGTSRTFAYSPKLSQI